MPITLGAHHPRLAAARELLTKKGREAQRRFLAEGPTLLEEAFAARAEIGDVFVTEEALTRYSTLLRQTDLAQLAVVSEAALAKLSALKQPPGIVATVKQRHASTAEVLEHEHVLLLAGLNDPGNVGTLLRSARAFGIQGVLLLTGSVELYNPKVVRSAMGALFGLACASISIEEFSIHALERPIIGADMHGESLDTFVFPTRSIIVIGHEHHGLANVDITPTFTIGIPQTETTESLNAGVAGSIILYILGRQKRLSSLG